MFDRRSYKQLAKRQLKGRMITPILATLIVTFVLTILNLEPMENSFRQLNSSIDNVELINYDTNIYYQTSKSYNVISLLITAITGVLAIAYCRIFILLQKTLKVVPFAEFLRGFSYWLKGVLGIFWFSLWIMIWSLLFIIPGIVKLYAYSQMFFILAENNKIGVLKAMRISKIITKGYKADLFVMSLSFIGWLFLSCLTFGILNIWVLPYGMMSFTNAYTDLKNIALKTGKLSIEDFQSN